MNTKKIRPHAKRDHRITGHIGALKFASDENVPARQADFSDYVSNE